MARIAPDGLDRPDGPGARAPRLDQVPRSWPWRPSRLGRARLLWIGTWAVLVLGALLTLMVLALFVGMRRNDAAIDADLGTATATVLTVGLLRTGVEFVTADGLTVRPPTGVLYPGLLSPGQRFMVEYSTANPDLVRVAGRTAAVGNMVLGLTLVVIWVIAGSLGILLRRWSGRPLIRRRPSWDGTPNPADGSPQTATGIPAAPAGGSTVTVSTGAQAD